MQVGDRANFTLYGDNIGLVTIIRKVGSPSDKYQWEVRADDGRDFVAMDHELEEV